MSATIMKYRGDLKLRAKKIVLRIANLRFVTKNSSSWWSFFKKGYGRLKVENKD